MSRAEVVPDLIPRIVAAAKGVNDSEDELKDRRYIRDSLIVAAVDAGVSQRAIAEAAGIRQPRVIAIVACFVPEPS